MNTKENIIDILKSNAGLYDDGHGSVLAVRQGHWPRVADEIIEKQCNRIEQLEKVVRELVELKDMKDEYESLPFFTKSLPPEKWATYKTRKPLAWEAARKHLKQNI